MAFVVVVKKINSSIDPDKIINIMEESNIPMGKNMKYYEKRNINKENYTYTLRIKYKSFNENNEEMCKFYDNLIQYKWIKLQYNKNINFKISMKTIDYYNYIYNNVIYRDYTF